MHKMLAVSALGLLALGIDAASLRTITNALPALAAHHVVEADAQAPRMLSRHDDEVQAPRTLLPRNDENQAPRRQNEDIQAPRDNDDLQAPRGREVRADA